MRPSLRAFLALALVLLGCTAACSVLVANDFSGLGSTCTLPDENDNACGKCVAAECSNELQANCSDTSNNAEELPAYQQLNACVKDPSPAANGGSTNCAAFLQDAASLQQMAPPASVFNLATCVFNKCSVGCSTCTDVDAGTSTCGQCIMQSCGPLSATNDLLSGTTSGCCGDTTVQGWISDCTYEPGGYTCNDLKSAVGAAFPDGGVGYVDAAAEPACGQGSLSEQNFAVCVFTSCIGSGKCQ